MIGSITSGAGGKLAVALVLSGAVLLAAVVSQAAGPRADAVAVTQAFSLTLTCSPLSVESGEDVTCSAAVLFDDDRQPVAYTWSPPGQGGASDSDRVFRFDQAGDQTVEVLACLAGPEVRPMSVCQHETAHITVDGDLISGLSCDPAAVNDRQQTTCTIGFADPRADITWTAGPNVTVGSLKGGTEFSTKFTMSGTATITAHACVSSANRPAPRCTDLSTTVEVSVGPNPSITSLSCAPDLLAPEEPVSCTATVENEPNRLVWSAIGGNPETGTGLAFGTRYAETGQFPISLVACLDGLGEPRCDTATTTVRVAGPLTPHISTPGCAPDLVPVGQVVACTPVVTGGQERFTWTAGPDASSTQGGSSRFTTSFSKPGTKTITLRVCVGGGPDAVGGGVRPEFCDELSQPITVTATTPSVELVACSPASVEAGGPVTCTARTAGPTPASWLWTADGGSPASGSSASFTTTFATAGPHTVRVQACISDRCGAGETTVSVTPPAPKAPVTTTLSLHVTEQDLGPCAYSVMPDTNGTVTLTVSFGPDGKPATASASLRGGGGGSRRVTCNGITATVTWSVTYSGSGLTGVVDPTTGAVSLTGTVTGQQTVTCTDKDGKRISCPPLNPPASWSYTTHLTGTITAAGTASGTRTVVMDSGCSTSGSW